MTERIHCCVPECRRSFRRSDVDDVHAEVMCGRCYRTVDRRLLERHKVLQRRAHKVEKLARMKLISRKASFWIQIDSLTGLFRRSFAKSWAAIKEDAFMKSALRVEGTAGELAARRRRAA